MRIKMETENVAGKKVPVKDGGVCIYCGWDGGEDGLKNEHVVPYSLGGNTELLNASCSDCGAITSYLDGYLANRIFGHLRVHLDLQSRSGHPNTLPGIVLAAEGERAIDFATEDHPFFLHMPIWRPPGFMLETARLEDDFSGANRFTYWFMPPNIAATLGLEDGDMFRLLDQAAPHNLRTFARALMKIAYCNAVLKHGLGGFRHLVAPDIILGRFPYMAYFVGSDPTAPTAPSPKHVQHFVGLGDVTYPGPRQKVKLLAATIRLFADSGTPERGMPYYTVLYGAEGRHRVIPKRRMPRYGSKILL